MMYKNLRTIFFKPVICINKAFLEIFILNKQIRKILKANFVKWYLRKYVKQAAKTKLDFKDTESKNIIWQYWEQGLENAPELVKVCIKSVEKYKNGNEHIILDKNNIKEYTDIPDFIWKLNEKGIIKSAHMSDIIRTYLLTKHGGVWVDATVLFTANLPKYITNSNLFVFQNVLKNDVDGLNMASYFIASKPHNIILEKTKWLLNKYWQENNFLNNYFMFLYAFTMITQANSELKAEYAKIPYFSFIPVQQFQEELLKPYNEERWNQIKSMSTIHKLTHKMNILTKDKNFDISGTFYEKLIKGELI